MQTDASNVTLPGLFANKCFRIPNYQRGYAWGESQLNDLWDDIMDIQKNGSTYRPHYIGAITLQQIDVNDLTPAEKKLSSTGMEYYNVVDGQQRLTTIVIMLNALKNKITTGKKQLINNYIVTNNNVCRFIYSDTNGNSYRFFKKNIIGETNILPFMPTIYTANLEFASSFFRDGEVSCVRWASLEEIHLEPCFTPFPHCFSVNKCNFLLTLSILSAKVRTSFRKRQSNEFLFCIGIPLLLLLRQQ